MFENNDSMHWRIGQLAGIAGVSVRTLHHYDAIGLLQPSGRGTGGYRFYTRRDLLVLQQILFYRELEFSLEQIKKIVQAPDFDICEALAAHKKALVARQKRIEMLVKTIDCTVESLLNQEQKMKDHEYYRGFVSQQQAEELDREARQLYGNEKVDESWKNIRKMGKVSFDELMQESRKNAQAIAALMNLDAGSSEVQHQIEWHHSFIGRFYEVTDDIYLGLADLYVNDARFKAFYESIAPGLAGFLASAMKEFVHRKK